MADNFPGVGMPDGYSLSKNIDSSDESGTNQVIQKSWTLEKYKQYGYINVKTDIPKDEFIDASYHGDKGYVDGTYLVPFPIEREQYNTRKALTVYNNIVQKILDAGWKPITNGIEDRMSESDLINSFLLDVDNGNFGDIQSFITMADELLYNHDYCMVMLSSHPDYVSGMSEADVINKRLFPYARILTPEMIVCKSDKVDQFGRLTEVTIYDCCMDIGNKKDVQCYMTINSTSYTTWCNSEDGKSIKVIDETVHGLGFLPVVAVKIGQQECREYWRPKRSKFPLCLSAWEVYNISSEVRDIERKAGFPILMIEGIVSGNFAAGPASAIVHATNTAHPEFKSLDPNLIEMYRKRIQDAINYMLSNAEQLGVSSSGNGKSDTSGIAYAFKFRGMNENLCAFSKKAYQLEYAIVDMFCRMLKKQNDYTVEYPDDFFVEDEIPFKDLLSMTTVDYELITTTKKKVQQLIAEEVWGEEYDANEETILADIDSYKFDDISTDNEAHV